MPWETKEEEEEMMGILLLDSFCGLVVGMIEAGDDAGGLMVGL